MDKIEIGFHPDLTDDEYHHGPGISKSGLDLINRSPAHFRANRLHPKPDKDHYAIGRAFHAAVLEPERFSTDFITVPSSAPRRPTAAQLNAKKPSAATLEAIAWWAEFDQENDGKTIISNTPGESDFWSPGDYDRVCRMAEAVFQHPIASILLDPSQGKAEQSAFWVDRETRKLCKCRPDFINEAHDVVVDLKSTVDASLSGFAKSAARYRYHVQDVFYRDGLYQLDRMVSGFIFVAVEKEPPYAVGVYVLDDEARHVGRVQYRHNLDIYAKCYERDEWPDYPGDSIFDASIRDLQLPPWGMKGDIS